jgi:drug/metabolite transporter (DMT)-like permease
MHAAGNADFWWASLFFRATAAAIVLAAALIRRPPLRVSGVDLPVVVLVGIGDMTGNLLFAAASAHGLVSVTSVLASLYPVVTIVLARAVLAERVASSQQLGIGLTLAGIGLISAG